MTTTDGAVPADDIDRIRAFNRFYTVLVGALDDGILASPFSLTEARVLYEVGHRGGGDGAASALARDLRLDPAYLSRILRRFRSLGLVSARKSERDGRARVLAITEKGRRELAALEAASSAEVEALVARLPARRRAGLVRAMAEIRESLDPAAVPGEPFAIRTHRPGDIGWIVSRHAVLYTRDYGWDGTFEAFVADIGRRFIEEFDPARERCWVAERHGDIVGSVTLVDGGEGTAKLRLLYVEADERGLGIGARLVAECIDFARACGYDRLMLWTNDILVPARRLYEAAGFRLIAEEPHRSFGQDLVGQTWSMDLAAAA